MKYHELKVKPTKKAKRLGRGISAGQGKTAGRGTKGQGARAGFSKKPGFSGGSNPLMQKLPKLPGFRSHKVAPEVVHIDELEQFSPKIIDAKLLYANNLISSPYVSVKVLNKGELKKKLTVNLPYASKTAIEAIQSAGGEFNKTARLQAEKTKKTDKTAS